VYFKLDLTVLYLIVLRVKVKVELLFIETLERYVGDILI